MNVVSLMGRVVRPIELKDAKGTAVMNNTVAVTNIHRSKEDTDNTAFVPIVAWGKVAERFAQYVEKGHRIAITGHIHTRSYTNKQKQQVYIVEVVVEDLFFIESKKQADEQAETDSLMDWLTNQETVEHKEDENIQ